MPILGRDGLSCQVDSGPVISIMTCKLTAIIEQDKHGVFAYCPELKGCHTQGQTVEEALTNLREAAELYLETLKPAELRRLNAKTILATSLEVEHA